MLRCVDGSTQLPNSKDVEGVQHAQYFASRQGIDTVAVDHWKRAWEEQKKVAEEHIAKAKQLQETIDRLQAEVEAATDREMRHQFHLNRASDTLRMEHHVRDRISACLKTLQATHDETLEELRVLRERHGVTVKSAHEEDELDHPEHARPTLDHPMADVILRSDAGIGITLTPAGPVHERGSNLAHESVPVGGQDLLQVP